MTMTATPTCDDIEGRTGHSWEYHNRGEFTFDVPVCRLCGEIDWSAIDQQLSVRAEAQLLRTGWALQHLLKHARFTPYSGDDVIDVVALMWQVHTSLHDGAGARAYPAITDKVVIEGPVADRITERAATLGLPVDILRAAVQQANRLDADMGTPRGVNIIAHAMLGVYGLPPADPSTSSPEPTSE